MGWGAGAWGTRHLRGNGLEKWTERPEEGLDLASQKVRRVEELQTCKYLQAEGWEKEV